MFFVCSLCLRDLVSCVRTAFLLESLQDLDEQLRAKGSRLFVVRGKPEEVLPGLFDEWKVKKLTFEADSEPRSRARDKKVGVLTEIPVFWRVTVTKLMDSFLLA